MAIIASFKGNGKGNKVYPALNLTKKDPKLAAMVAKVERSNLPTNHDENGNRRTVVTNAYVFRSMLQKRAKRNADATAIIKLLPDIELSAQILTSSILSPTDMMTMELIYGGPKTLLSSELSSAMLNRMKEHFEEDYKIKDVLAEMIREPLFERGSYPIAVIPENAIDDIINGSKKLSMEELKYHFQDSGIARNIGVLGPHIELAPKSKIGVVFENHRLASSRAMTASINNHVHYKDFDDNKLPEWADYVSEEYLVVVDNPNVLKIPKINEMTKAGAIKKQFAEGGLKSGLQTSLEDWHDGKGSISDTQIERAIYRTRQHNAEPILTVKHQHDLQRKSVGNPLILKLPTESVLPVHVPGNPKQHIGYFILLDEEGNPISSPDGDQMHPGLKNDTANSVGSNLIKKASMNMGTSGDNFDPLNPIHVNFAQQIYSDMIERDLISRVKNGIYSSSVAIARNEEVYRVMLARVLARKYTQLLYLPIEYMTYIAFKYGDDGIGRSMLDDQAMINTLRSVLLFSDVMASVKNSIGRTKVTATLPENDPNPMKTIEHAMDEIVRSRTLGIPLGVSNPADVMEFIQRAGYEWEFGGHKGLPDLKFDFVQTNSSYAKPDQDLTDHLRKSSIMGFGLSPETVDNGFNAEFATTAVANNVLLSKRVVMWQDIFTPQLSDHLRKVALHTEDLINDLKEILSNNTNGINLDIKDIDGAAGEALNEEVRNKILVSKALIDFIAGFNVTLPKPTSVTLENQLTELKNYADSLDVGLDAYVTSDLFAQTVVGELSNEASTVRNLIKSYFIRKFMADKNILSELADLVTADEDGNPQLNIMEQIKSHLEAMSKAGVKTLIGLQPNVQAVNADLKTGGVTVGENSETTSSEYGGGGSSGDSSGGGDDLGGFEFGGGEAGGDLGDLGGEPPAEGEGTEEETPSGTEEEAPPEEGEEKKPAEPKTGL